MPEDAEKKKQEERIQQLELELKTEKEKNQELQKQKTVRLDEDQLAQFLEELTKRSNDRTEYIAQEIQDKKMTVNVRTGGGGNRKDVFSTIVRIALTVLFIAIGIVIIAGLTQLWGSFWGQGWAQKTALIIMTFAAGVCILIGIDINREKDRNYMISMFSAVVALVALVVTLMIHSGCIQ